MQAVVVAASEAGTLFETLTRSATKVFVATAWASDGTRVARSLWRARTKIDVLVVGLDFHQTDPTFLKRFARWVRVRKSVDGTFHPKVYLFERGERFDAIVGSSNFTAGGFNRNVEANLHVQGATADKLFAELKSFILSAQEEAEIMSAAELARYAKRHRELQKTLRDAKKYQPPPVPPWRAPSLHVKWNEYYRQMLEVAEHKDVWLFPEKPGVPETHIGLLEYNDGLFKRKRRLAAMTGEERKAVGGFGEPYWIFGNMVGAGRFRKQVMRKPANMDQALGHIPPRGVDGVSRAQFDAFVASITKHAGLGSPASGSRLLAMKRPDVFLCLDSANRVGLAKAFGFKPGHLTSYDAYWELLEKVWRCPWWKSARPADRKQRRVWDGRVAMLDVFFYEHE